MRNNSLIFEREKGEIVKIVFQRKHPEYRIVADMLCNREWNKIKYIISKCGGDIRVKRTIWDLLLDCFELRVVDFGCEYHRRITSMVEYPWLNDKRITHTKIFNGWRIESDKELGLIFEKRKK